METTYETFNDALLELLGEISSAPSFDWTKMDSFEETEFALQLHRFQKKFMRPDETVQVKLTKECVARYRLGEQKLHKFSNLYRANWPLPYLGYVRNEVKKIIKHFRFRPELGWFGPGESFFSSGGDVSVYAKLVATEWSVTPGCINLLKLLIRNNRVFRRIMLERARAAARRKAEDKLKELTGLINLRSPRALGKVSELLYEIRRLVRASRAHRPEPLTFNEQFSLTWKLVPGGRFSSVPKDNRKRRPINVEPLGNILVQKAIGIALKNALQLSGNDLWCGQADHQQLIADIGNATLDLSDASDSISWKLIRDVFPPSFVKLLEKSRSPFSRVNNQWVSLEKISSMGNGFTFEVLTTVLLSLARAIGAKHARVYGDDIIVPVAQAPELMTVLGLYGFTVNQEKSFVSGPIRESCGAFTYNGQYLKSFDFEWLTSDLDVVTTMNKLYIMKQCSRDPAARAYWAHWWYRLIELVPLSGTGPVPTDFAKGDRLDEYVWNESIDENYASEGPSLWIERAYQLRRNSVHRVQVVRLHPMYLTLEDIPFVGKVRNRLLHLGKLLRLVSKAPVKRHMANILSCQSETWYADSRGLLMNRTMYKSLRNQGCISEGPSCWGREEYKRGAAEYKDLALLYT